MTYRDDLAALAARHAALEHEVAQKTSELERASQLLEEASTRARLPVLDNIRVASPCGVGWETMTGDDRTRHCGSCNKQVYNLSSLTRDEAETLIVARAGQLCVRYFQRADGTILLNDCTVGVSRRRRRRVIVAGAAALLAGAGGLAAGAHALGPEQRDLDELEISDDARESVDVSGFARRADELIRAEQSEPNPEEIVGQMAIQGE